MRCMLRTTSAPSTATSTVWNARLWRARSAPFNSSFVVSTPVSSFVVSTPVCSFVVSTPVSSFVVSTPVCSFQLLSVFLSIYWCLRHSLALAFIGIRHSYASSGIHWHQVTIGTSAFFRARRQIVYEWQGKVTQCARDGHVAHTYGMT